VARQETEIGLGSARDVPLKKARELATGARGSRWRDQSQGFGAQEQGSANVRPSGSAFYRSMRPSWKNPKHAEHWQMTLIGADENGKATKFDYCASLRGLAIDKVTTSDFFAVRNPIWLEKPDTAKRTRGSYRESARGG
jgi:hypothetical protein